MSQDAMSINPDLVWDYEIPEDGHQDEGFRRWYIARVLSRGRMEDVRENDAKIIPRTHVGARGCSSRQD